ASSRPARSRRRMRKRPCCATSTPTRPSPATSPRRGCRRRNRMTIALIDYGSGNLRSAAKAFERAVADLGRRDAVVVTADPAVVARADRLVLPGVGAFADCRAGVLAIPGMMDALTEAVIARGQPFFGI